MVLEIYLPLLPQRFQPRQTETSIRHQKHYLNKWI